MNEQLIVKNFGPIKDATVDFKKVTVFIGPTGGGKSTLAKLAAIFHNRSYDSMNNKITEGKSSSILEEYNLSSFPSTESIVILKSESLTKAFDFDDNVVLAKYNKMEKFRPNTRLFNQAEKILKEIKYLESEEEQLLSLDKANKLIEKAKANFENYQTEHDNKRYPNMPRYIPAERVFIPSIEYSWAGLMRDDIGLPKLLLNFANSFSISRKEVSELAIDFLNIEYQHIDGRDFIKIPERDEPLMLLETASGIQSVTPLLVLLENLSRQREQVQSFIIEEPELNLYPTAQQGLLNWLVEKCTQGENDLTITTHSPYILAHLNLLLYAYQVAEKHPDRADDVAKIVPRESWINPKEFACYHVEGQKENGVHSIVNPETELISYNGLDSTATAEASDFEKLLDINAGLEVE